VSLIDIKEHLIQEIKWLKLQIDCVENEEEEYDSCDRCDECGYNPNNDKGIDFYYKLELAEELLNNFFPEPNNLVEKEKKLTRRENVGN
tara:strand:- start:2180 stop:2446 length:267 start_codon:yes stop_codon:yes gene_type:complete